MQARAFFVMGDPTGGRRTDLISPPVEAFSHEVLLYAGLEDFTRGASAFIREGLTADEAVLVVVDREKIERLRAELGDDAGLARFADMDEVGLNPARIIPAWRDFVNEQAASGRAFRGIGEPISPRRSPPELVESQRHESLLNLAFDGPPAWRLLCPYDTDALTPDVIEEALRSHPIVRRDDREARSDRFRGLASFAAPFDAPLPEPPTTAEILGFDLTALRTLRTYVGNRAEALGLDRSRATDLVLAVNEVATNSVRHGGGHGLLRLWREADTVVCEIRDQGHIDRPLLGRERPILGQDGGLGVWLANQLCDLVQIRSFPDGTVVRIHMSMA